MAETTAQPKRTTLRIVLIILVIISVAAVAASVILYGKYRQAQDGEQAQAERLVAQLAKVVELPAAKPAVVTVTNKDKLSNQALAVRVANQDKLLIYSQDKRIVVYRPSTNKIVDMLSFETSAELTKSQQAAPEPRPANAKQ